MHGVVRGERANRRLTQQQINDMTGKPEWLDLIRAAMGAGQRGRARERPAGRLARRRPRVKPKTEMRRSPPYQEPFETPRGRTVVQCTASQDRFDGLRQDYDSITAGVTLST